MPPPAEGEDLLRPDICVASSGLNQNYTSRAGTGYHIQIEDRGPVFDDATEAWVRRVNIIAYANYGEPDRPDRHGPGPRLPGRAHPRAQPVRRAEDPGAGGRGREPCLEEREERQVARIKGLLAALLPEPGRLGEGGVRGGEPPLSLRLRPRLAGAEGGAVGRGAGRRPRPTEAAESGPPGMDETVYPLDPAQQELGPGDRAGRGDELERDLGGAEGPGARGRHPPGDLREDPGPGPREPHPARRRVGPTSRRGVSR